MKTEIHSDNNGEYRFTDLLPGTYELSASAAGFAPNSLKGLLIEANKTSTIDLVLQPGQITASIKVIDAPAVIDTTTANIVSSFDARKSQNLPVSSIGLDTLNLALLNAGVPAERQPERGTRSRGGEQHPEQQLS